MQICVNKSLDDFGKRKIYSNGFWNKSNYVKHGFLSCAPK